MNMESGASFFAAAEADTKGGMQNTPHTKTARILFQDPGRISLRSVAISAFAAQEPHGGIPMAYTWP